LYRVRNQKIEQLTRDHTVIGERMRMGLITAERARNHPDRSSLSRSIEQELIPSIDRITTPLLQHDRLIMCSDDGMASIFKAVDRLNGHTVAVKSPTHISRAMWSSMDASSARKRSSARGMLALSAEDCSADCSARGSPNRKALF
jgi:hypothetical protein